MVTNKRKPISIMIGSTEKLCRGLKTAHVGRPWTILLELYLLTMVLWLMAQTTDFVDFTPIEQDGDVAALRLAAIVESSHDAILSKDLNGTIMSWNSGAERIFGYTANEVIGRPITMLMPADRINEEPGILGRIKAGERIDHYETIRMRKDGNLVNISLTVSPVRDKHGTIIGASKIARDITDRKKLEAQREVLMAELNHRVQKYARDRYVHRKTFIH